MQTIPGSPIAYWAPRSIIDAFQKYGAMANTATPKVGVQTGDNDKFIRQWWEVSKSSMHRPENPEESQSSKWFPCNKGGGFRKWYGNNELVINWGNDGLEIKNEKRSVIRNSTYYFREGMTWGTISSAALSMRYSPSGFMFETKGSMCFASSHSKLMYCLAFTNSSVVKEFHKILSPTLDYHEGPMGKLPLKIERENEVVSLAEDAVPIAREDWDAFETSWDFEKHPLV